MERRPVARDRWPCPGAGGGRGGASARGRPAPPRLGRYRRARSPPAPRLHSSQAFRPDRPPPAQPSPRPRRPGKPDPRARAQAQGCGIPVQSRPNLETPHRCCDLAIAIQTTAVVYTTDRNSAMPNDVKSRRSSIQSIDRATAILKALASGPRRLGVSELADRLGLARPTVHGLLQTLQSHGFVEQDRHSDKYQLGPGLLQLGYSYLDLNELRARSIGYADRLATRAAAAVRVGVMHGSNVVVVHHVFRPDAAFGVLEVGLQLPLHASSLGKAILAFSPEQVIEDLLADPLPRLTNRTVQEAALRKELQTIRDQGVATERDEAVLAESSAASPIFDHGGHAVGAIGVVDTTERIFPRGLAKGVAAAVGEAARGVSRELGAPRWPYAAEA